MTVGDKVYTVNAKNNNVDVWQFAGAIKIKDEILYQLSKGKKSCLLPKRCVFDSREKAQAIANSKK